MSESGVTRAMVLAAGYGTRLRPLTETTPKPLIPVMGRPLADHIVDRLAAVGVDEIVLNTHHRPEAIRAWAASRGDGPRLELVHEAEILGTGGALANVRDHFQTDESFLLHNGDVWAEADLQALVDEHARTGALFTMLLVDRARINSVLLSVDGAVKDVGGLLGVDAEADDRGLTYTGVAVVARTFLDRLPDGFSNLADALVAAIDERPGSVRGLAPRGLEWSDLGTPRSYLDLHERLLSGDDPVLRGRDVRVHPDAEIRGFCMLGDGCVVRSGVMLEDCLVMSGAVVNGPAHYNNLVIGEGWWMAGHLMVKDFDPALKPLLEAAGFVDALVEPMDGQGSDRVFWRILSPPRCAVLMDSRGDPSEFERSLAVAEFLVDHGLGGAALLARHETHAVALQEDCGEETLLKVLRREPDDGNASYGAVLSLLADLQAATPIAVAGACPEACDRRFGVSDLRAETVYFRTRYLEEHLGLDEERLGGLDEEFDALAEAVAAQPAVLMHRDFQSTNILLHRGGVRLVDVQGMRLGPRGYDVASLLRDPYADLSEDRIAELLERWCTLVDAEPATLRREVVLAGLQRNMQALGAYAYLSRVKERRGFTRWFAPGLRQLAAGLAAAAALDDAPSLPKICALVDELVGVDTRAE